MLHRFSHLTLSQLKSFSGKPLATSLNSLMSAKPSWLLNELPHRYLHLIRFLSLKPKLERVQNRYMRDIDFFALSFSSWYFSNPAVSTSITTTRSPIQKLLLDLEQIPNNNSQQNRNSKLIKILSKLESRNKKSLEIVKSLNGSLDCKEMEDVLTLNYAVSVLLDDFLYLVNSKDHKHVVEMVDMTLLAQEAVDRFMKNNNQTNLNIRVENVCIGNGKSKTIKSLHIKSHILLMIEDMISSFVDNQDDIESKNIKLIIARGTEDISLRISIDEKATKPISNSKQRAVSNDPNYSMAQVIARYWGGDYEIIRMGNLTYAYLHIKATDCRERIPPVLETAHAHLSERLMFDKT